jgi:hypothetical protein
MPRIIVSFLLLVLLLSLAGISPVYAQETTTPPAVLSISSVTPSVGEQGQSYQLTISGQLFTNETTVSFSPPDGITVSQVTFVSATQILVDISIAENAPTSARDITVTSPGAAGDITATLKVGFTVLEAPLPLMITSISPSECYQGQDVKLDIVGQGFVDGTTITFWNGGGVDILDMTLFSSTEIMLNIHIDVHATVGFRDIEAHNPDGQMYIFKEHFTILAVTTTSTTTTSTTSTTSSTTSSTTTSTTTTPLGGSTTPTDSEGGGNSSLLIICIVVGAAVVAGIGAWIWIHTHRGKAPQGGASLRPDNKTPPPTDASASTNMPGSEGDFMKPKSVQGGFAVSGRSSTLIDSNPVGITGLGGEVTYYIRSSSTGEPVPGAEITLEQEPDDDPIIAQGGIPTGNVQFVQGVPFQIKGPSGLFANGVTGKGGKFALQIPKATKLPEKFTLTFDFSTKDRGPIKYIGKLKLPKMDYEEIGFVLTAEQWQIPTKMAGAGSGPGSGPVDKTPHAMFTTVNHYGINEDGIK